jgi:hypothetical protein
VTSILTIASYLSSREIGLKFEAPNIEIRNNLECSNDPKLRMGCRFEILKVRICLGIRDSIFGFK